MRFLKKRPESAAPVTEHTPSAAEGGQAADAPFAASALLPVLPQMSAAPVVAEPTDEDRVRAQAQERAQWLMASRDPLTSPDEKYRFTPGVRAVAGETIASALGLSATGESPIGQVVAGEQFFAPPRPVEQVDLTGLGAVELCLPVAPPVVFYDDLVAEWGLDPEVFSAAFAEQVRAAEAATVPMSTDLGAANGTAADAEPEAADQVQPPLPDDALSSVVEVEAQQVEFVEPVEPVEQFGEESAAQEPVAQEPVAQEPVGVVAASDLPPLPVMPALAMPGQPVVAAEAAEQPGDQSALTDPTTQPHAASPSEPQVEPQVEPQAVPEVEPEDEPVWVNTEFAPSTQAEKEALDTLMADLQAFSDMPNGPTLPPFVPQPDES